MPTLQTNGITLAYDRHGDRSGEPVLLVCGTGQQALTWLPFQVPALVAAGYEVVTFDNRGMAPSDSPPPPYSVETMVQDTAGLIESLGIGPCRVAGLSLGAFIAQELALARPDLVRAAALMGTIGRQSAFVRALFQAWVELDESGVTLPLSHDVVYSTAMLFSPSVLADEDRVSVLLQMGLVMPPFIGVGAHGQHTADVGYDDRLAALAGVTVPTLVVVFEHDLVTLAPQGREVAAAIPGARLVEIDGVGHAGPFEDPERINAALLEFFVSC